jgi:hypothetical protein
MAKRAHPTPTDADNSSGSLPAACSDWRVGDADSMSARTTTESTPDAGYTTAGDSQTAKLSARLFQVGGSPYTKGCRSCCARRECAHRTQMAGALPCFRRSRLGRCLLLRVNAAQGVPENPVIYTPQVEALAGAALRLAAARHIAPSPCRARRRSCQRSLQPQTSCAVSITSRSLARWASTAMSLPCTVLLKPHWGDRAS